MQSIHLIGATEQDIPLLWDFSHADGDTRTLAEWQQEWPYWWICRIGREVVAVVRQSDTPCDFHRPTQSYDLSRLHVHPLWPEASIREFLTRAEALALEPHRPGRSLNPAKALTVPSAH